MPDFLTRAEVEAVAKRALSSEPTSKVDPTSVSKKGTFTNVLLVGAGGALAEEVERRAEAKLLALTRAGAQDAELDAVIFEETFGQVTRLGAAPAVVTVQIGRPAAGGAGIILAGTTLVAGSVQFALDVAVPFAIGQKGPIITTATATVAGLATNVADGAINAFKDASALFDPTLTVTNQSTINDGSGAAAGGEDREIDQAFRKRADDWVFAIQKATLEAIAFGIQQVSGVRQVVVEEDTASGRVTAYISDSNGNANQALVTRVTLALIKYRAAGIRVAVIGSVPTYVPIVLAPEYLDGYATQPVQALARATIVAAVNRTLPKKNLQRSLLVAALRTVPGLNVTDGSVVLPVGDTVPLQGQTFRTRDDLVTFTSR